MLTFQIFDGKYFDGWSVSYQILYWLKNLMGLILTVWLESVKNVKISPVKISHYTVAISIVYTASDLQVATCS